MSIMVFTTHTLKMDVLKYLKSIHLITLAQFQALFLKLQDNRSNRSSNAGRTATRSYRMYNAGCSDCPGASRTELGIEPM